MQGFKFIAVHGRKKLLKLSLDINEINRDVQEGMLSPVGETSRLEQRAIQIQCSSILDNFLYVGGVKVASNLETLLENKITHIINCVGHKCKTLWPDHFEYLTYKIPDNGTDDICPYLREAFEFIENAKRKHGKDSDTLCQRNITIASYRDGLLDVETTTYCRGCFGRCQGP